MAVQPTDADTFVREVEEELRRERLGNFLSRYGWAIGAAIVLLLGAIGGSIWWQGRQQTQAAAQGEQLLKALDEIEAGNRRAANTRIAELGQSGRDGYRNAALFTRANAEMEAGNRAAAIATLRSIAGDEDFAEPYRQAALVRQTALEFDTLAPQEVIRRLSPLARPGQPWFGTAGELVAIACLRAGRANRAGPLFAAIARDERVPPSIRTRTVQMAGSLGINAMPDSITQPAPAAPAGAATEENQQ
ncbi:MAG: tetratricopeptide repeat protein [Sphingosinicella sp.]